MSRGTLLSYIRRTHRILKVRTTICGLDKVLSHEPTALSAVKQVFIINHHRQPTAGLGSPLRRGLKPYVPTKCG